MRSILHEKHDRICRGAALLTAALATSTVSAGCGAGSAPPGFGEDHGDIVIAATGIGTGQIAIEYDASEAIEVFFNTCIGGTGDDCEGGFVLYSSEEPGFDALLENDTEHGLFPLAAGTPVSIELTSNDSGTSFFMNGTSLSSPGDSVVLGVALEGLHAHGEWQLTLPGGMPPTGEYFIGFRLTTSSQQYAQSVPFGITLTVGQAAP